MPGRRTTVSDTGCPLAVSRNSWVSDSPTRLPATDMISRIPVIDGGASAEASSAITVRANCSVSGVAGSCAPGSTSVRVAGRPGTGVGEDHAALRARPRRLAPSAERHIRQIVERLAERRRTGEPRLGRRFEVEAGVSWCEAGRSLRLPHRLITHLDDRDEPGFL